MTRYLSRPPAARAKSPSRTTPGAPRKEGKKTHPRAAGPAPLTPSSQQVSDELNQEHYTNTHFPEDTEKNDRKSRVPAAAAAFLRAARRWRSAFVSFWWHGVQSVRKLSKLQQPPPSATGII